MNIYPSELIDTVEKIQFDKINDHPNILIAASFWEKERYHAAKVCYRFMRMIDDLIDDRKASGEKIATNEKHKLSEKVNNWINCLSMTYSDDPFLKELNETVKTFKIPLQLFHNFARSMQYDIDHNGFSTFDQFLSYSGGASVAPASVFVHLCCLNKQSGEYHLPPFDVIEVAEPCAIFSYIVHIIRDFQKDQKNNLNYFALDILEKYNLKPRDLKEFACGKPINDAFRKVMEEYYSHAIRYRNKTLLELNKLSSYIKGRYLFSLHVIFNLYQMVFERIDIRKSNFTKEELNPTPLEIKQKVLQMIRKY
jgi:phytoene/squalene synthetase